MFVPDDRFSHVAGMRADQALPIEGTARGGDPFLLNILQRKSTERAAFKSIDRLVFAALYRLVPGVCPENSQTGDGDPLAPGRIPSLLALEIEIARWPTKGSAGGSSAHSRHEY
jgi:hypothetical protein